MQHVGFALWQLQCLEDTLATYVIVRLRDSLGVGLKKGAELTAEMARMELGKLIAQLRDAGVLSAELTLKLGAIRSERNWLVHRVWREHHGVIASDTRLAALMERLTVLGDT